VTPVSPPPVTPVSPPPVTPVSPPPVTPVSPPPGTGNGNIPSAQSVYETGTMVLPSAVKGVIISIPDEGHESPTADNIISSKNPSYLPTSLVIPTGTSIAFVHGDPGHVHTGTVTDSNRGTVAWETTAVEHPGGSDVKVLPAGTYDVTDEDYSEMKGKITVSNNVASAGNLVVGGLFVPTPSLEKYKSDFAKAGFSVLSTHNFVVNSSQKDISGPNTLIVYSTTTPIDQAIPKLFPIIKSLPYK
jgi:hypothetical protein